MGNPFTSPSISGYNSNPPSDDGTQNDANEITWDKHKTKLGDPVKTLAETLVTNTNSAFAKVIGGGGVTASAISYTVLAGDQGKLVRMTGSSTTLTTPDATTVESPFVFAFVNDTGGNMTLDGSGAQTINGETTITVPDNKGGLLFTDGSNWFLAGQNFDATPTLPRGYLGGLQISQDTDSDHDILIAVGEARDFADTQNLTLTTAITKQIDANWAAGDDAGGFPSGISLSGTTWYHVFLVDDGSGGTDAGFDSSTTATNLLADSGGTKYRRIGSVLTDGSNNILGFTQIGDVFLWSDPPLDVDNATPGTTANTATISTPLGYKCEAKMNAQLNAGQPLYVSSPDVSDEAPSISASPIGSSYDGSNSHAGYVEAWTNTSSQIRHRGSNNQTYITTLGWRDNLGKYD